MSNYIPCPVSIEAHSQNLPSVKGVVHELNLCTQCASWKLSQAVALMHFATLAITSVNHVYVTNKIRFDSGVRKPVQFVSLTIMNVERCETRETADKET
jgi:hypothetical protein